eukprot:TRINITY_DN13650_c0_g1_i6.p1 TRINITY_DN13650_c0_g1~~TRINITY_DN13650_c0_g1_i6.p1  ORF type:complete len:324 (+),score=37.60 TRINITY_DN13650_c0_g1_i6:94-1065(+)
MVRSIASISANFGFLAFLLAYGARIIEQPLVQGHLQKDNNLTSFFLKEYPQKILLEDSNSYVLDGVSSGSIPIPTYECRTNGIKVGANPLVLCTAPVDKWKDDCVALYHYTSYKGIVNIMNPYKSHAEIWAALKKESTSDVWSGAKWGEGVYCTGKEPCAFQSEKQVLQNNYGNKALNDPDWHKALTKRAGNAQFAIAMIVDRAIAYNMKTEVTPEMVGKIRPGFTSKGEQIRDGRDIWVVQVKRNGKTVSVKANVQQQLEEQVSTLSASKNKLALATAQNRLASLLQGPARANMQKRSHFLKKLWLQEEPSWVTLTLIRWLP